MYISDDACFTSEDGIVLKSGVPGPCSAELLKKFGPDSEGVDLAGSSCTCTKEGNKSKIF